MSDDFDAALRAFAEVAEQRVLDTVTISTDIAFNSLQDGDPLTGAPGQPVDEFILKPSFHREDIAPGISEFTTDKEYAESIEDGEGAHGALTLRSKVGGFHSLALTEAAWADRIVPEATKRAGGEADG